MTTISQAVAMTSNDDFISAIIDVQNELVPAIAAPRTNQQLTALLNVGANEISVPRDLQAMDAQAMLDRGLIRETGLRNDDETRPDYCYEVTEFGADVAWGRI